MNIDEITMRRLGGSPQSVPIGQRADITIHRVGQEVWIEHARPGLRFRFEQNREEIGQLVAICQGMLDRWDADTEAIAEKMRKYEASEVKR